MLRPNGCGYLRACRVSSSSLHELVGRRSMEAVVQNTCRRQTSAFLTHGDIPGPVIRGESETCSGICGEMSGFGQASPGSSPIDVVLANRRTNCQGCESYRCGAGKDTVGRVWSGSACAASSPEPEQQAAAANRGSAFVDKKGWLLCSWRRSASPSVAAWCGTTAAESGQTRPISC
jgi:hypothetical protein